MSLSVLPGKHWSCLQGLSQSSIHSLLDGPLGAQGHLEKDEAETVSAMASLSVDVEQPGSVPEDTETSRSAGRLGSVDDVRLIVRCFDVKSCRLVLNRSTEEPMEEEPVL